MVETGDEPKKIIKEKGLKQQSDPKELEKIIVKVLEKNSDKVSEYKSGKVKLFGFKNSDLPQFNLENIEVLINKNLIEKKLIKPLYLS